MRMLNVLPRVTERTRERVAREFDDLGPDVCMNSIMRDLQRHNPELLDMASKWANDVGAADRIVTAFGMFYRLLSAEALASRTAGGGLFLRRPAGRLFLRR